MRGLAVAAEDVETALWIKGPEDLRNLVACGQVTACFNLLRYILEERATQLGTAGAREAEIHERADELWRQLKEDAYVLLR